MYFAHPTLGPFQSCYMFFKVFVSPFFAVAGINGSKKEGCRSLVLSGGYADDKDFGDEFTYSGNEVKLTSFLVVLH